MEMMAWIEDQDRGLDSVWFVIEYVVETLMACAALSVGVRLVGSVWVKRRVEIFALYEVLIVTRIDRFRIGCSEGE